MALLFVVQVRSGAAGVTGDVSLSVVIFGFKNYIESINSLMVVTN